MWRRYVLVLDFDHDVLTDAHKAVAAASRVLEMFFIVSAAARARRAR
jgi:hypothetical protein